MAASLIEAAVKRSRLANAYLLIGDNLDDKKKMALSLAAYLNCTGNGDNSSCFSLGKLLEASCQNCRWICLEKHPQALHILSVDFQKTKISVEKARELSLELAKTSSYSRVIIVEDASEAVFHRPAANALLKTIEEAGSRGTGQSIFLLFARSVDNVLATIVSRCQVIPVLAEPGSLAGQLGSILKGGTRPRSQEEEEIFQALSSQPFFEWTRKYFASGSLSALKRPFRATSTRCAVELADYLFEIVGKDGDGALAIDCAVFMEVEIIGTRAITVPILSHYLRRVLTLSETAKQRLIHYVSRKSVFESFLFEWNQAREELAG